MLTLFFAGSMALCPAVAAPATLPAWAQTQWQQDGLGNTFDRKPYAKPGILQADFNGDGKPDVAVLVTRRATGSWGVVILHQGMAQHHVVGTGPGTHADILQGDFSWVDHWQLYTKPTTEENLFGPAGDLAGSRRVRLKRPTIELTKEEVGGGMIYWNGKRYIWIHQTC